MKRKEKWTHRPYFDMFLNAACFNSLRDKGYLLNYELSNLGKKYF
jgi:hypothetical protein